MKKLSFFLILSLFVSQTAYALPIMDSAENQKFDQNTGSVEVRNITITEDVTETFITAGELKITIPDDIDIIFDAPRTKSEITVAGTALDGGRVDRVPAVTFEDSDKTMVIPILSDFLPGEVMILRGVYWEGFHTSSGTSKFIYLTLQSGSTVNDLRDVFIQAGSIVDTRSPETPTNLVVSDVGKAVKLTWTDPTDLDLSWVDVLRGKNETAVSGTTYQEVKAGVQEFIDTDVVEGDTVKYILRATDGRNMSPNTIQITFVVGSGTTAPTAVVEEPIVEEEVVVEEPVVEEEPVADEELVEEPAPEPSFNDIAGHWGEDMILALANQGVVSGDPDGGFRPDDSLNKAEAAAMLHRILSIGSPVIGDDKPFSDVELDAWYAGYISDLKGLELVNGNPDGTYLPEKYINRAEFLKLAINAYKFRADTVTKAEILAFEQGPKTSNYQDLEDDLWYTGTVTAATELGFISGIPCGNETCFKPSANITRAEASKILYQIFILE